MFLERLLLFPLALVACTGIAEAQQVGKARLVTGQLQRADQPAPEIKTTLISGNLRIESVYTDSAGLFAFEDVSYGHYVVEFDISKDARPLRTEFEVASPIVRVPTTKIPVGLSYHSLDLTPNLTAANNLPFEHLTIPPNGTVSFKGISFQFPQSGNATFGTQTNREQDRPTECPILITQPIKDVRTINILINAHWLDNGRVINPKFAGKKIGEIFVSFTDERSFTVDLIGGENIRETWAYKGHAPLPPSNSTYDKLINVYTESQLRGGEPAEAYIDMLQVIIPEKFWSKQLKSIIIKDTSVDTVNDKDPGLNVMGVAVGLAR
jgi:hypothetical protein